MIDRSRPISEPNPNLLKQRLDKVRIATFEEAMSRHKRAIARLQQESERHFDHYEAMLLHYENIDDAFQTLISAVSAPTTKLAYQTERLDTFIEQGEWRLAYLQHLESDFPFAIAQYQAIHQQIEAAITTYGHLIKPETGVLSANGHKRSRKMRRERLTRMRMEAHNSRDYVRAKQLIAQKAHQAALEQIFEAFFTNRNYMYRDVAQLFAQLVSALKSNNPELVSAASGALSTNQNVTLGLIIFSSILIGFVLDNVTALWQPEPIFAYIPIALVGLLWLGTLILFIRARNRS